MGEPEGQRRSKFAAALVSALPIVSEAKSYESRWLSKDIVAGLVLTALLVPQGMAYAQLAGLPPVTGLYTSILCLLGYAVFGPSRILVLGPDSALGPMIAATIVPLMAANGDPETAIALASMLALMVGAIMLIAGVAKLGMVADLLSKPAQIGYMNGLALVIVVGQLPKLFGFSVDGSGVIAEFGNFLRGVADGKTVPAALAIGIFALAVILVLQRWFRRIPAVLTAVVLCIAASIIFGLADRGVSLVGALPQGFPPLTWPRISASDIPLLVAGAFGIALVTLTDTIATATAFASRNKQEVHANHEMVGIGAANVAAGLFQGFPVSTSASRTAVAEQSGARTQLTGIVGAATIALMIVALPDLLQNLPNPTLAAVVIAAALSLADVRATRRLWNQRRTEWVVACAAFLGVALLGVLPGIVLAIAISILNVFRRAWWPHQARLGLVEGIDGLHDVSRYESARELEGMVVYRFDAPLFFANARTFRGEIRRLAEAEPRPRWILLAAEPITDVDTTAAEVLITLDEELAERDIQLAFAELKDPVKARLEHYGLRRSITDHCFFRTIDEAIAAYLALYPEADWRPQV